jgi:hypothetical protein
MKGRSQRARLPSPGGQHNAPCRGKRYTDKDLEMLTITGTLMHQVTREQRTKEHSFRYAAR